MKLTPQISLAISALSLAEFAGAGHQCPTSMGGADRKKVFGKLGIAWFKRFIDEDTRYTEFLAKGSF